MPEQNTVQFRCTIKKMFKGCPKENGWFGCFAHIRGDDNDIKLKGTTNTNLTKGMQLDVTCTHDSKDDSYDVIDFQIVTKTKQGLVSYLASLPGVSKPIASEIILQYGTDALDIIKTDPDKVQTELSLSDKQIKALTSGVNSADDNNLLRQFLQELSPQLIRRVKCTYDKPVKEIIADITYNPYILCDIPGISFPKADSIALRLGFDPTSPFRVNHGLMHILETESSGNLFVNLTNTDEIQELCNKVEYLLQIKFASLNEFGTRIMQFAAIEDSPIYIDNYKNEYHLYLTSLYNDMTSLVSIINTHKNDITFFDQQNKTHSSVGLLINQYETDNNLIYKLTKEQQTAVKNALQNKISIITGGPGRGKTTIIDCIAYAWTNMQQTQKHHTATKVLLLAPTGKAMNKLKQATNNRYEAMTIDKVIVSMSHDVKSFPILSNEKTLIVIDESSMIDINKASSLMNYLPQCQYCFVGDIDQLPPISPGNFLSNLIDSNKITTSYLTTPLRNSGDILANAEKINNNDTSLKYTFNEMAMINQDTLDDTEAVNDIIQQYIDEKDDCPDITQIALLSPMRKGAMGTVNLNILIQDISCPLNIMPTITYDKRRGRQTIITKGFPINSTIYGNGTKYTKFRIGDIIINTKNNSTVDTAYYDKNDYWNGTIIARNSGIYNGDCGRIIGYVPENSTNDEHDIIIVQFFDNRFAEFDIVAGEFEPFELGYALTVHKSQGCEYQTVIYVSPKSLLNVIKTGFACKNLVYTAVTRAKNKVVIMGSKEAFDQCILHNTPARNSNVAERIT